MAPFNMNDIPATDVDEISDAWIYKFYCKMYNRPIYQPFDGRTIKISSFKNRDSNPSLAIYYNKDKRRYYWRDFTTGENGDPVSFLAYISNKNYGICAQQIINDYDKFIETGGNPEVFESNRELANTSFIYKPYPGLWKEGLHGKFWSKYKISLDTLIHFNVVPLDKYAYIQNTTERYYYTHSYGYMSDKFGLYQIYQPDNPDRKYLNNKSDYIIGFDQLENNSDTLVICSGLKDIMALYEVGLDVECLAPKSETTLFSARDIEDFKGMYKNVVTMLDNDKAGIKSMLNYQKIYGISMVLIDLEKDLADNLAKHNKDYLKVKYTLAINKQINKNINERANTSSGISI